MLLTSIVAKGLALADAILGYFVGVTGSSVSNICGSLWITYNVELTACGQAHTLAELMTDLFELHVLLGILPGLFAM